jgi:hypothetical protein
MLAYQYLALDLVKVLFALEDRSAEYRKRVEELYHSHPDHELFGSLPGAGPELAPRFLAEIGNDRERFEGDGSVSYGESLNQNCCKRVSNGALPAFSSVALDRFPIAFEL